MVCPFAEIPLSVLLIFMFVDKAWDLWSSGSCWDSNVDSWVNLVNPVVDCNSMIVVTIESVTEAKMSFSSLGAVDCSGMIGFSFIVKDTAMQSFCLGELQSKNSLRNL